MKSKLLTLAGALALLAVGGKFYAIPAIAQAVRAAVTKNIDEPARVPYQAKITCIGAVECNLANGLAYLSLLGVPAHSRLVIQQVSLLVQTNGTLNVAELATSFPAEGPSVPIDPPLAFLPFTATQSGYMINQPVRYYYEGIETPVIGVGVTAPTDGSSFSISMHGMVSGYAVDLSQ